MNRQNDDTMTTESPSDGTMDRPKRPLSAYNIFFANERQKILAERPVRPQGAPRRSHGKMGFATMAKTIAERWNVLPSVDRKPFEDLAKIEKTKYKAKMATYNLQQKAFAAAEKKRKKQEQQLNRIETMVPEPVVISNFSSSSTSSYSSLSASGSLTSKDSRKKSSLKQEAGFVSNDNQMSFSSRSSSNATLSNSPPHAPDQELLQLLQQNMQALSKPSSTLPQDQQVHLLQQVIQLQQQVILQQQQQQLCPVFEQPCPSVVEAKKAPDSARAETLTAPSPFLMTQGVATPATTTLHQGIDQLANNLEHDCVDWLVNLFDDEDE